MTSANDDVAHGESQSLASHPTPGLEEVSEQGPLPQPLVPVASTKVGGLEAGAEVEGDKGLKGPEVAKVAEHVQPNHLSALRKQSASRKAKTPQDCRSVLSVPCDEGQSFRDHF